MSTPSDNDTADLLLDRAIRQQEATRHNLPVLSRTSRPRAVNSQIIGQLKHDEEEMRIFHQQDLQRHEAIQRAMAKRLEKMIQEDQGSTMRIEEFERQRDTLNAAVGHVNQVHQHAKAEYTLVVQRIEEASQAQHRRDQDVAESLQQQLGHLRSEASQSFVQYERQVQGEGLNMAREYEKLVDELQEKSRENLQLRTESSNR